MNVETKKSNWLIIWTIVPILLIGIYIFNHSILPLQEFPDWQFQGWLWNQIVFHNTDFGGYYTLHSYIPPNSTFTVLIGLLNLGFSPFTAGKIAIFLSCSVLFIGILFFSRVHLCRKLTPDKVSTIAASSIAFLFVFNFNLFFGQIHFLLGLGIALLGAYLFHEKNWGSKPIRMMLVFFICYSTHFMAFTQLVLYVIITTIVEKKYENIRPIMIALFPTALIFVHYLITRSISGVDATMSISQVLKEKVMVFPRIIAPFVRLKGIVGNSESALKILNFAISGFWMWSVMWVLFTHIKRKQAAVLDWMLLITFLIAVILPPVSLGMFAPGERFVMFGAIAGILLFLVEFPKFRFFTVSCLVVLSSLNYIWSFYQTTKFEQKVASQLVISNTDNTGLVDPFMRLVYYKALQEQKTIPIFTTGLFSFSDSIKPDIYFNSGQMKVKAIDTTSNINHYDPYR